MRQWTIIVKSYWKDTWDLSSESIPMIQSHSWELGKGYNNSDDRNSIGKSTFHKRSCFAQDYNAYFSGIMDYGLIFCFCVGYWNVCFWKSVYRLSFPVGLIKMMSYIRNNYPTFKKYILGALRNKCGSVSLLIFLTFSLFSFLIKSFL